MRKTKLLKGSIATSKKASSNTNPAISFDFKLIPLRKV